VFRLWLREVSNSTAKIDLWLKERAPGTAIGNQFSRDPENGMRIYVHSTNLVHGAKANQHNRAVVCKEYPENACG
jgi:uncharacterized protein YeaO (DUF488 family)